MKTKRNYRDFTVRMTWVHLLRQKSDVFQAVKEFVKMAKNQFGEDVKILRSDNALKFDDQHQCKPFFFEHGIIHQTSCTDGP